MKIKFTKKELWDLIGEAIRSQYDWVICEIPEEQIVREPDESKRWARAAYYSEIDKEWVITGLYSSKEEAEDSLLGDYIRKVIWPARFDEKGFLIIPKEK